MIYAEQKYLPEPANQKEWIMSSKLELNSSILLVDDETEFLQLLQEALSHRGATVHTAESGTIALEFLAAEKVDIVITDRNMPGLGGQELLIEIREKWPEIDVLMMTGVSSVRNAVEAMRLGAADFLEKPIDLATTVSILKRVENNRSIRLERDRLKAHLSMRELGQVITSNLHMADLPFRIAELITRTFKAPDTTIQYFFDSKMDEKILWRSGGSDEADELSEKEQLLTIEANASLSIVQRSTEDSHMSCVPLITESQCMGNILLSRDLEQGEFNLQERELLQVMASNVTIALENAHVYQLATRQTHNTRKFAEIGRKLNASLEMEDTQVEIHSGIEAFVETDFTVVIALDRNLTELSIDLRGLRHPDPELLLQMQDLFYARIAKIKEQHFEWREKHLNQEYDLSSDTVITGDVRHIEWVPLSDVKGVFGLLGIIRIIGSNFTVPEVQNIMHLSSHASSALQNSMLYTSQQRIHLETVQVLSKAIDEKDHYTHGHSAQVGEISVKIAQEMGIHSQKELSELRLGGLMHDLGKIGIKDSVLNKPGKLDSEEYEHIKTHPLIGSEILLRAPHLLYLNKYVRSHHERWDGNGYPDGLCGEEIPENVRIMSVADTFHAMASDRVYRKRMDVDKLLGILREESGSMFEPKVIESFFRLWDSGQIDFDDVNFPPENPDGS
jgi:response regulator RpfG family c-di-GMP phosphodiesterase